MQDDECGERVWYISVEEGGMVHLSGHMHQPQVPPQHHKHTKEQALALAQLHQSLQPE